MAQFNWSPGIGDPTIGGWLTVALYLAATVSCWFTARSLGRGDTGNSQEHRAWQAIWVLFLALGINKQLDLQSALTEVGRLLAQSQGWYAQRQFVQQAFIALVGVICAIVAITLLIWARNAPFPTWVALTGTMMVLVFVLIRAASFHHMDRFIGERIFGLRWNWILEMSGISIVFLASQRRRARLEWQ